MTLSEALKNSKMLETNKFYWSLTENKLDL